MKKEALWVVLSGILLLGYFYAAQGVIEESQPEFNRFKEAIKQKKVVFILKADTLRYEAQVDDMRNKVVIIFNENHMHVVFRNNLACQEVVVMSDQRLIGHDESEIVLREQKIPTSLKYTDHIRFVYK